MTTIRVAIVGAGLTGLATAAAFSRNGHQVRIFEQAPGLRASGLAINLWSNATSLLPGCGIPAHHVPGEPFSRMLLRASGRDVAAMELPAEGLPHVNVERADLLTALAAILPPDAVTYGARCADMPALAALAGEHDLVVVADGANSALRTAVAPRPAGGGRGRSGRRASPRRSRRCRRGRAPRCSGQGSSAGSGGCQQGASPGSPDNPAAPAATAPACSAT